MLIDKIIFSFSGSENTDISILSWWEKEISSSEVFPVLTNVTYFLIMQFYFTLYNICSIQLQFLEGFFTEGSLMKHLKHLNNTIFFQNEAKSFPVDSSKRRI